MEDGVWSSSKEFHIGDTLLFSYINHYHNVFEVTAYTITLERPDHYYFLCGVPSHYDARQKVEVVVNNLPTPIDNPVISPSQAPSGSSTPSTLSPTSSALSSPVYKVGGSSGWIIGVDYNQWSSPKQFHVGDTLLFSYNHYHNVFEVIEQGFKSYNSKSPIADYSSSLNYITLERPDHYYFLCGALGHCESR
uniref:mavicyanin-like n=1 Tax=Fragaria vesca subsp. vesca TaxID=101020 RepID=UPI0005CAA70C|nr:PREDICTED: mavicyanin-like [Fragaria vesca subsp. vesca]